MFHLSPPPFHFTSIYLGGFNEFEEKTKNKDILNGLICYFKLLFKKKLHGKVKRAQTWHEANSKDTQKYKYIYLQ